MSRNHKPLPERDVNPADIPRLVAAAHELPGVSPTLARHLGGWLVAVHAGVDSCPPQTAVRYRKILRQLGELGHLEPPPAGRKRPARGQAGLASVRTIGLATMGSGGVAAVATGHPAAAIGQLVITMIGPAGPEEHAGQELRAA